MSHLSLYLLLVLPGLVWQSEVVPYKPSEEFQLELDFKFKQRPVNDPSVFNYTETRGEHDKKQYAAGPLPYLLINCKILKLADGEVRVRVINGKGDVVVSKKAEAGSEFKIDLGYTDDMKDRVSPYEYNIFFLSARKKELSRIHMLIQEDGTFMVNEENRGKF